ncbi:MAG: 30S ribosomal protein S4e [archaeon]
MSYLKRQKMPKSWPIPRKGKTYVVSPYSGLKNGLPLLIILRDILKIAKNRNEAKKAIKSKLILLNGKEVFEERSLVCLFDTLSIVPSKKSYRMVLSEKGKFMIEEIKENESLKKISKIINKKMIGGEKIQINLMDGRNVLSNIKAKVNDSVVFSFKEKKIEKILPLKEGVNVLVFAGKHAGKKSMIDKVDNKKKMVELKLNDKPTQVLIKQLIVME